VVYTTLRCRGNIILELNESNATRLLLDRLKTTTLTKDKEYFLATGAPSLSDDKQKEVQLDMVRGDFNDWRRCEMLYTY